MNARTCSENTPAYCTIDVTAESQMRGTLAASWPVRLGMMHSYSHKLPDKLASSPHEEAPQ